jgi:putative membrane protein
MMVDGWPGQTMHVRLSRGTVPAGPVSLRVRDVGMLEHELVVLPLADGARPGQRSVGPDGTVSEAGSLGEVSDNCGPGAPGWRRMDHPEATAGSLRAGLQPARTLRRGHVRRARRDEELSTMMGWNHDGGGWGGWILMAVLMLAFWALVVFAVIAIFRGTGRARGSEERTAGRDALDILGERFARGEIDAEEYQARARILRQAGADRPDDVAGRPG